MPEVPRAPLYLQLDHGPARFPQCPCQTFGPVKLSVSISKRVRHTKWLSEAVFTFRCFTCVVQPCLPIGETIA